MSRRNDGVVQLDLKLNLSPPRSQWPPESPTRSSSSPMTVSPTNSCVSLELHQDELTTTELRYSSSPEETTSMMLAGCPRCLMYVMLAEEEYPKCPKCKSTVLLDVVFDKPIKSKLNN
ncbi:hypothetical protein L6452_24361 [Arctium lappa]|uniref:Uncharacterized protein n=1 Tax=Arctium lappa TaxID=4217 RepID=A0ACB9A8T0_ARCLA|nr:hypothetical protein L6452_24361 [Arctium lappa]